MAEPTFDLQSHSQYSDGALPAAEVVALAAAQGVELLALTDHDTVDGVAEAITAAHEHGIGLVPAVELSTVDHHTEDLHLLGYRIDHEDPTLAERLRGARHEREERAKAMGERLLELGFKIFDKPLARRHKAGQSIGRPHIAASVLAHRKNRRRLEEEGLHDVGGFIETYLVPGAPAYVPRRRPTVEEAIGWVHDAGGLAVWAHPFWDIGNEEAVLATLERFSTEGLDGVEAFYATHTEAQTKALVAKAGDLQILTTGSADFHGPEHRLFNRFRAFSLYGLEPYLGPLADPR
jgi:predicted metal-dependent phosphoesterase TrpH